MNDSFWKNRNVFITGATGLLGFWITSCLVEHGANVVVLVRKSIPEPFKDTFSKTKVIKGNVTDYEKILSALKDNRIETVFHLAAQTISPVANKNPLDTFETNIKGTWIVLEACRNTKTIGRIVVASSDKAYGEDEDLPYTEDSSLTAKRPYTVSKSCADLIAQSYFATYNLPICITRCGNFFGGGDLLFDRLVPSVIKAALFNKELVIRSDGKYTRDFFYVEDGALATIELAEAMNNKNILGNAFNFSTENPLTVLEFIEIILKKMKSKITPKVLGEPLNEVRNQYLSSKKAREVLKWKPQFSFGEGVERTINWYKNYFKGD